MLAIIFFAPIVLILGYFFAVAVLAVLGVLFGAVTSSKGG